MRRIAPETLKEQIRELAPEWDDSLVPWEDHTGGIHLGYSHPVRIPLAGIGIDFVDDLETPFAPIGADYPIAKCMENRVRRWEVRPSDRYDERKRRRRADAEAEMEPVDHELRKDIRDLITGKIQVAR